MRGDSSPMRCRAARLPGARPLPHLLALLAILVVPVVAWAQGTEILVGSKVLVVNTEGQGLNLRESPSQSAKLVVKAPEQSILEVVGAERRAENRRWVQVRDDGGRVGWAAVDYLSVLAAPPRTIVQQGGLPESQEDPGPPPQDSNPPGSGPGSTTAQEPTATPPPTPTPKPGSPLTVEAKAKVPETSDRRQTLTVTVSRDGSPVSDVTIIAITQNVDPPIVRILGRTDDEGIVSRSFDIKRDDGEKGTVVQVVTAVHPDGGTGWESVSWFKR
jgi:Bacterial SH3 domain